MAWQFWIDRGGTFTDVVACSPDGDLHHSKLLSENPEQYGDAALEAMRRITGAGSAPLPPAELRLGTTVATNALLERKGEPVLLAITRGFADALMIGTQERPELFAREIILPGPLHARFAEIDERIGADGQIITPLDENQARSAFVAAYRSGLRAIAIVLMHGYRFTAHEDRLAQIAREVGFTQISVSHQLAPLIKLIARGDTCVVDAYLSPVLHRYVEGLQHGLGNAGTALFMQSNGGLTDGATFQGKDAILSGPAGGIVGMAYTAQQAGFDHVVGFDMGGTSTDVSHYAGEFERDNETRIAGVRIRTPMMRIHTVAAGGGSVCSFDGARFLVGPHSAGALPGPACYRRGGPLTVTDCNLLLGKLQPDFFPSVFGPHGDQPLDIAAAEAAMDGILAQIAKASGITYTRQQAARGFLQIAVANMANAIKKVSLQRGHDVTRATLASFGGAGGQHCCAIADALGMDTILCHPFASVLSAYGMGLADRHVMHETTLGLPFDAAHFTQIMESAAEAGAAAGLELAQQTGTHSGIRHEHTVFLRARGTDNAIGVPLGTRAAMETAFCAAWLARFGFAVQGPLMAETLRVEAIAPGGRGAHQMAQLPDVTLCASSDAKINYAEIYWAQTGSDGHPRPTPIYERGRLAPGFECSGPALIVDPVSTIGVEPGWSLRVDTFGNIILNRTSARTGAITDTAMRDPVRLEIMGALFMAVAEEMGAALQSTARSVNIRERLDFSCAIFDGTGALIANAPHMPVHLGSMGQSVRTIIRHRHKGADGRGILAGDVYALNAPYEGGTHLPDITAIMPVFENPDDTAPAWFVAARGHHGDIGGIAPGSMPPTSRFVDEEGILIDNFLLVDQGILRETQCRDLLLSGKWPARNPDQNLADLKAQIAACTKGAAQLRRIAAQQGRAAVDAYMGHLQDAAEEAVRAMLGNLQGGGMFTCPMDNGAQLCVRIEVDSKQRSATIDFSGTSPQQADNFNAPLPVVRAAVLYVIRTLIDDAVLMNEGCLRPIDIIVPEGSMLNPRAPAAVVAGNVETSQIITDGLFAAFGAMAASQGTMNNLTFGSDTYQYYETIAGGAGAGPGFSGACAVQTHMTNSRLTDPEILENNFPVRLEEFSIRRGSGGTGQWPGGNGIIRKIVFLEKMEAAILSGRRNTPPFGLAGGNAGQAGENWLIRADGQKTNLGSCASMTMEKGDALAIHTPGGGGYGASGKQQE